MQCVPQRASGKSCASRWRGRECMQREQARASFRMRQGSKRRQEGRIAHGACCRSQVGGLRPQLPPGEGDECWRTYFSRRMLARWTVRQAWAAFVHAGAWPFVPFAWEPACLAAAGASSSSSCHSCVELLNCHSCLV